MVSCIIPQKQERVAQQIELIFPRLESLEFEI